MRIHGSSLSIRIGLQGQTHCLSKDGGSCPLNAEKGPGVTLLLVVLLASALLEGERVDSVALALSLCDGERQF